MIKVTYYFTTTCVKYACTTTLFTIAEDFTICASVVILLSDFLLFRPILRIKLETCVFEWTSDFAAYSADIDSS